jgi:hypothetical protein
MARLLGCWVAVKDEVKYGMDMDMWLSKCYDVFH